MTLKPSRLEGLAVNLAHELQVPLLVIVDQLEVVLDSLEPGERLEESEFLERVRCRVMEPEAH